MRIMINNQDVWDWIGLEERRQEDHIELIASENYTSKEVMRAQGSCLTNKYAEGYPNSRYYGGCANADLIEIKTIESAKKLFKAERANVQSHSGSQANQSVYFSFLKKDDTLIGLSLAHGGHLSHGSVVNVSGRHFNTIRYGINLREVVDYRSVSVLAFHYKPKLIVAGASAFPLRLDFALLRELAEAHGTLLMSDCSHYSGFVVAGLYPSPVPFSAFVTTTTHKSLRGPRGGLILMKKKHGGQINHGTFPMLQGGPMVHTIAAKAVALSEGLKKSFVLYQKDVMKNANLSAKIFAMNDLKIVSSKTESHMILLDLRKTNLSGSDCETALQNMNVIVNRNVVPGDQNSSKTTSGMRIGFGAITSRGIGIREVASISNVILKTIKSNLGADVISESVERMREIVRCFPVY